MKALVLGGSRGIGRSIADELAKARCEVDALSSSELDTANVDGVAEYCGGRDVDVLVLNTGGPPPKTFEEATIHDWERYHKQLFLGFVAVLQNIRVNDGGYIFLISSSVIKEPNPKLVISSAYRAAFAEVFKVQSRRYAKNDISCVNIAPGPINTDRTRQLVENIEQYRQELPMGRLGEPEEIGRFVAAIVTQRIKYLSGVTINFDGAMSGFVF